MELSVVAERVLKELDKRSLSLATAESCTAGRLATLLADAPGAGERFLGGFVVYSKRQKTAVLGVSPDLIANSTAVSEPVAEAMALGILAACPADIGVAVTGVAGPRPDEDGNPVGLIHIAAARRGGDVRHRKLELGEDTRDRLCARSMRHALELALTLLQDDLRSPARNPIPFAHAGFPSNR